VRQAVGAAETVARGGGRALQAIETGSRSFGGALARGAFRGGSSAATNAAAYAASCSAARAFGVAADSAAAAPAASVAAGSSGATQAAATAEAEAVTTGAASGAARRTLYHYTSEAGEQGIRESGVLLPSLNPRNARYGPGQ